MVSFILPGNSASGGFDVANSLRFNSGSSDYLTKSNGSGSTTKATISVWVKHTFGSSEDIFQSFNNAENAFRIRFRDTGEIELQADISNSTILYKKTNALFRDPSAWMHICVIINLSDGTAEDKVQLYVNGIRITSFATNTTTSTTSGAWVGGSSDFGFTIGRNPGNSNYYNGYMSEFVFIDNNNLAADQFGEFDEDTGIWKPIDVSGLTYGTNGFYLDFEDSSALGNDVAGSNNFTVNNLTAIDQSTDTCTNNFATLNALAKGGNATFSEGNLKCTTGAYSSSSVTYTTSTSTIGVSTGKWYWEYKLPSGNLNYVLYGITSLEFDGLNTDVMTNFKTSYAKTAYANEFRYNTAGGSYSTDTTGFSTDSTGDIVKIALDLDNNFIYVGNGSSWFNSGNPESGASGTGAAKAVVAGLTYFPMMITLSNSMEINFGSPPYSESGGNSDGDGYGNFNQAVPSGYYSLNTKNLAEYG